MITLILPYGDDRTRYESHLLKFLQRNSEAVSKTAVTITLHAGEPGHHPRTSEPLPPNQDLARLASRVAVKIVALIQHPKFQDLDVAFNRVAVNFYDAT